MTSSRRIILNALATYGRSLLALAIGLFTTRWVLQALGTSDFGLYGIVGAMLVFITFINGISSNGIVRFYAYAIGQGEGASVDVATENLSRWVNTAFSVHLVVPLVSVAIGYPIGVYAIEHWLVIPAERIGACLWVFRIALATSLISMMSQPFIALYVAYQYIVELALFGVMSSIITFAGAWYLKQANFDRLVLYAVIMGVVHGCIPILQTIRAFYRFPACRIRLIYLFDWRKIRQMFGFSGWYFWGAVGALFRNEGTAVLVNIYFGPRVNAAFGVGNQVSAQSSSLATAFIGALSPAIISAEGAGRRGLMIDLAYRACKFGALLVLLFAIPLALEMPEVLRLWLKEVPECSVMLCNLMLTLLLLDKLTVGHMMAINAEGRIGFYQATLGFFMLLTLPVAWCLVLMTGQVESLCVAFFFTQVLSLLGRLYFCHRNLGMDPRCWLFRVFIPIFFLFIVSTSVGGVAVFTLRSGLLRLCITSCITAFVTLLCGWLFVLDGKERDYLLNSACKLLDRLFGGGQA